MKNFLLRLMKLIVIPCLLLGYSILMSVPVAITLLMVLPMNIITYLFSGKFWFPVGLFEWHGPMCDLMDMVMSIGVNKDV